MEPPKMQQENIDYKVLGEIMRFADDCKKGGIGDIPAIAAWQRLARETEPNTLGYAIGAYLTLRPADPPRCCCGGGR